MDFITPMDNVEVKQIPTDERIKKVITLYKNEFSRNPTFVVRVPGRVNIIGEHIDYCGYPVLPMALEQDILIAAGPIREQLLRIRNSSDKHIGYDCNISTLNGINMKHDINGKPFWYNYVLCGLIGALEYLHNETKNGLEILVDGIIPPASGLSSSSALVSASCLTFLYGQGVSTNKKEIASLCASSERYIGTQGGGMDQAIAFLAEKNSAQYIAFNPLTATPVALPEEAAFVVANSISEINKAATNDFNCRVIECRLAAKILQIKEANETYDKKMITLSKVQNIIGANLEKMVLLVKKHLPKDIYTKDEVCSILNTDNDELERLYLTENTRHLNSFKLKQRALHVYEEAMRVEKFRSICTQSNMCNGNGLENRTNGSLHGNGDSRSIVDTLGELMSASHESLKTLYECSHENLDKLVNISKEINIHARLTGAGWGGCIVAICPKNRVQHYIDTLKREFYDKLPNQPDNYNSVIFATTPAEGAAIYLTEYH